MKVDYERLKQSVAEIIREVEHGEKNPIRRPGVQLRVVRDLQGEVTAGPFTYRTDAALDAGGFAEHPRPMDYVLGALASCQQMWCLRWAAQNSVALTDLVIEAESVFSWRGEYLQEVDAGMNELHVSRLCQPLARRDHSRIILRDFRRPAPRQYRHNRPRRVQPMPRRKFFA